VKRILVLFLILFAQSTLAQSCPDTVESFSKWMTFYYQQPDSKNISCTLQYYADSKLFSEYKNSRMPTANFYAETLLAKPELIEELISKLNKNGSANAKIFALHVFWVMPDDMAQVYLTKVQKLWEEEKIKIILEKMSGNRPRYPLKDGPVTSGDLDNLWAIYFASGNKQAIQQIASVLHLLEDGHGIDIAIGGAARWSLESNSKYHKDILGILEKMAKKESGIQREMLIKMVKKVSANGT